RPLALPAPGTPPRRGSPGRLRRPLRMPLRRRASRARHARGTRLDAARPRGRRLLPEPDDRPPRGARGRARRARREQDRSGGVALELFLLPGEPAASGLPFFFFAAC